MPFSFAEIWPGFAGFGGEEFGAEQGVKVGAASSSTLLHELSHGAFVYFNDPEGTDVAAHEFTDEVEAWAENPESGYERLAGAFQSYIQFGNTWHLGASIPAFVGGNINLVPPKLRHWFPWLGKGDIKNWDEAREQYQQANAEQRYLLLDTLYSNQHELVGGPPLENPGPGLKPEPREIEATRQAWRANIAYYDEHREELEQRWAQEDPGFWQAYVEGINGQRQILGFAHEIESQVGGGRGTTGPGRGGGGQLSSWEEFREIAGPEIAGDLEAWWQEGKQYSRPAFDYLWSLWKKYPSGQKSYDDWLAHLRSLRGG